ncbi:DUF3667 domain-containing protein [Pontibacter ruber]|uniref:DUF3667 domain-containing protein n=1 Tax=Pontibacter ruber TaxID=1343895 RepID=A0ABW5CXV2_9BACT|nr:DUF3667 domain-containing protein [Pontibacter ruber]
MAKKRRKLTQCPNCGYTFDDTNNYCPNCGQENHDLNVPVKHLIAEFLEGTLHFDTKVWKTLKYLILKPGLLSEKFNIGQRASYVPPFRLYVFVSLIFFFVLALTTKSTVQLQSTKGDKPVAALPGMTINANLADSLALAADSAKLEKLEEVAAAAEEMKALKTNIIQDERATLVAEKFSKFISNSEGSKQKLLKNISFMMFLLMPFFAWLLNLFYRKQGRNYVEHLMFSIHLHTFYFILLIISMLAGHYLPVPDLSGVVIGIMILYLFLALHRVYKQSYVRTLLRLIPIGFTYLITLAFFLVSTVFMSVLLS